MNKLLNSIHLFAIEDDGAQIVEYALIIAVIALTLTIALSNLTGPHFSGFTGRVSDCLMLVTCT
jgi:pilus assembly protein Flp/PilA